LDFSSTYYIKLLAQFGNYRSVVSFVAVVTIHRKVFKPKCKVSLLSCNWIETINTSVFKSDVSFFLELSLPKCGHRSCRKLLQTFNILVTQCDAFFLLSDEFGRLIFVKLLIICFSKGVVVVVAILSKLEGGLIRIALGLLCVVRQLMLSAEEPFKGR
jgi:hypothetical protein